MLTWHHPVISTLAVRFRNMSWHQVQIWSTLYLTDALNLALAIWNKKELKKSTKKKERGDWGNIHKILSVIMANQKHPLLPISHMSVLYVHLPLMIPGGNNFHKYVHKPFWQKFSCSKAANQKLTNLQSTTKSQSNRTFSTHSRSSQSKKGDLW